MTTPTPRAVALLAASFPVALLPVLLAPRWWVVWLVLLGGSMLLVVADAVLALPKRRLDVDVDAPDLLFIGGEDPIELSLRAHRSHLDTRVAVLAELGENLKPQPAVHAVIPRGGSCRLRVPLVPLRRGVARVDAVWLRWTGPLGLMARSLRRSLDVAVKVTPNIRAMRSDALRFFSNREFLTGLKIQRFVGDGSEFESLREYHPGLDHRAIDWKASARHKKLLVRDFRAERNHQIYLAFDTGHLMGEPIGGIPKLDHAINAALLLGLLSIKAGDRVGLFAFDDQVRLFSEAQRGTQTVRRLQAQTAELDYGLAECNYTVGLTGLLTRLRRRSLVVLFTDFVDTVTAELMVDNVHRLARRHLVIFVTLRDALVDEIIDSAPTSLSQLNRAVVAADFSREREVVLRRLGRLGVFCIEAHPQKISARLINRYLDIKRRELV